MYRAQMWIVAAAIVTCAALPTSHVVHEHRDHQLHGWVKRGPVVRDLILPVRIGLTQTNLDRGYDLLMEVSDPTSPKYSQHYTSEEVIDLFAPSPKTVDAVKSWLESEGFRSHAISQSANKQWIQVEAFPHQLERLLRTKYYMWEQISSGKRGLACEEYFVPDHLVAHIDYITPGIKMQILRHSTLQGSREKKRFAPLQIEQSAQTYSSLESREIHTNPGQFKDCAHKMTPQCIQAIYNVTGEVPAIPGNGLGIYAQSDDTCQVISLKAFFEKVYPKIPADTRPETLDVDTPRYKVIGEIEGECDFDMTSAYPLVYPEKVTIFNVDDKPSLDYSDVYNETTHNYNVFGPFNTWLDALDGSYCNYTAYGITGDSPGIDPAFPDPKPGADSWHHPLQCGIYKPTNVITVSYYNAESFYPPLYEKRQCNEYMKLGLQGITLFVITGDSGAGGGSGTPNPRNGTDCQGPKGNVFVPNYPATCPYITSVGSTKVPLGSNIFENSEVAAEFSSGGFSNVFTPPKYQKQAVSNYLTKYPPKYKSYSTTNGKDIGKGGGIFNRNGRGSPDVSCIGVNIVTAGQDYSRKTHTYTNKTYIGLGSGTSGSSPIWAGMLTRINAARLKAGKKTVGFINPTLYAHPEAFNDITSGHNFGCADDHVAFEAQPGWDPVTGLGSPKFDKLMEIFMALQ